MQLSFSNQNFKYNPSFSSCCRDVVDCAGKLVHRNDTSFFRQDIKDWDKFVDYFERKFKDAEKVNIYSLACSAGDEPYSLAIKLIEKLGEEKAKKYFPIIASDYDEKIIRMANDGYLPILDEDIDVLNFHTNGKISKYFTLADSLPGYIKDMDLFFDGLLKVKPVLRDKVNFSVADATEKCKIINNDNAIILARNFWPYLQGEDKRIKLASDLYKNLGKNSAVVVGNFDDSYGSYASKNLQDTGFVCNPEIYTIYEKYPVNYKHLSNIYIKNDNLLYK